MRRTLTCMILFLFLTSTVSAALTYDLSFRPGGYLSYDDTYGSYETHIQTDIDAGFGLSADVIDDLAFRAELKFGRVNAETLFATQMLRGFDSVALGLGTGMRFCDYFGFYSMIYGHYSRYIGTSVYFAHIETAVTPYFLVDRNDIFDLYIDIPVSYDFRRDLEHNFSAGINFRVSFPNGGDR